MKFPHYLQYDMMDCGPTCLRIIAKHYGKNFSLEQLRNKSHITREGVSMLGIAEAAENLGFRTMGVKISVEKLLKAPLPCVLHWNQKHFVVLYGIKSTKTHKRKNERHLQFFVSDPAGGLLKFSQEEFCRCWLSSQQSGKSVGTALLFEPTPDFYAFEDEKNEKKGFAFLFRYLKPYKSLVVQLFLGLLFGSLLQLTFPFLTQSIVDYGIGNSNLGFIYLVLIAQLVLTLSSASVEFIRGWILLHLSTRINISLISDFLAKLMRLPMNYFDTKMTGDIIQRIGDHRRIQDYLTGSTFGTLFSIFNFVIFGIILVWYNPLIFTIFIIGSILYFLWVKLFLKKRAELDHKNFALNSANQSNIVQLVTGMQEIKLNTCETEKRWEWEHLQAQMFRLGIKGLALGQYQSSGALLINQIKDLIITVLVASLVVDGKMTLGMMMSVQYIIGQLNAPVNQLIGFIQQTQDARLSLNRLSEVHNMEDEEKAEEQQITDIDDEDIVFKDIDFAYNQTSVGELVLKNINLRIPKGKTTAVVGMSGSGKTTFVKLLLGYYAPTMGEICIGNNNLNNYSLREWRKSCGVVMQDGYIFSDTIARNICPIGENIDKQRLLISAQTANIHSFIQGLPLGYNTKIGQEGHNLSQGQKQRILIARAVYKNPKFVFFDEATNALDANNERIISDNLNIFFKGKTVIIVAHRLSTVRNADQIVVLEKGRIEEIGTHTELIGRKGSYYELIRNQLELGV